MISLEFDQSRPGFSVLDGATLFRFDFTSAPAEAHLGTSRKSASYWVRRGVRSTIFQEGSTIVILFSRDSVFPCTFKIEIDGAQEATRSLIRCGDRSFAMKTKDGDFDPAQGLATMPGMQMRIEIKPIEASEPGLLSIDPEAENWGPITRMPEFSIGIFDKYSGSEHTIPRPLRHGVPVVSTLPVEPGTPVVEADKQLLDIGASQEQRTMYFRIICNRIIENDLSAGDLSDLILQISLPSGVDTVAPPVNVPVYYVGKDDEYTPESQSIYRAEYTFHQEDTICNVDGFFYLSVYYPMTVQQSLPLAFRSA